MKQSEQLLKLIDGHIDCMIASLEITMDNKSDIAYYQGMRSVRWLVYNFFNTPKAIRLLKPEGE